MNKVLDRKELTERITNMERGTVYTLNVLNNDKDNIYCTMITKTRWFDSHVVIIGGADDELYVSDNFGCEDGDIITEVIEDLVDRFIEEALKNQYDKFTLTNKSAINIKSSTPSLRCDKFDNFEYV